MIDCCDIDAEARLALEAYKARRFSGSRRPCRTKLQEAGSELEAVKCYLRGFTINETASYLKSKCGVKVNRSCVARFFRALYVSGVRY